MTAKQSEWSGGEIRPIFIVFMDFAHSLYYAVINKLRISFLDGEILYEGSRRKYSETDPARDVPETNKLFHLTTNFLAKVGISPAELSKTENGKPKINCYENEFYHFGRLTNIPSRSVGFRRAMGGVEFYYDQGHGTIDFGEHGRIFNVQLSWPSLEPDKFYKSATPTKIMEWIRGGKAIQKHMMTTNGGETIIDWPSVKSLTINSARAYYWGDYFRGREDSGKPILPSWIIPYAAISGTVDTGSTNLDVEIVCPVIDENNPLKVAGR